MGNGEWKVGLYYLYIHFHVTTKRVQHIHDCTKRHKNTLTHKEIFCLSCDLTDLSLMSSHLMFVHYLWLLVNSLLVDGEKCLCD